MGLYQRNSLRLRMVFLLVLVAVMSADGRSPRRLPRSALRRAKRMSDMSVGDFARHICDYSRKGFFLDLFQYLSECAPKDGLFVFALMKELCHHRGALLNLWVAELYDNGDAIISPEEMGHNHV